MSVTIPTDMDASWRWQTGGLRALTPEQAKDAEASYDRWLRRYGLDRMGDVIIEELKDFIAAIQNASSRTCGLEACHPTVEDLDDDEMPLDVRDDLAAAMGELDQALTDFLKSYRVYDRCFERLKASPGLFPPLEQAPQALTLDRAAWRLSSAAMAAGSAASAADTSLVHSPLRHPFLVARTMKYLVTVLLSGDDAPAPPPPPHGGDPRELAADAQAEVRAWVEAHAAGHDDRRRVREKRLITKETRAAMMRWLEGIGKLETVAEIADDHGVPLAVTPKGLTAQQREDLRGLRVEMNGYYALKLDVEAQYESLQVAIDNDDELGIEREHKTAQRLEEMRDHHKARATYFWVRSFHFDPDAQNEAAWLAPRLINNVRREIAPEIEEQSGEVGAFLEEQTPEVREAVRAMAEASQEIASTEGAVAAAPEDAGAAVSTSNGGAGGKGGTVSSIKRLAARIARAAHSIGDTALVAMRGVLPALAQRADQARALLTLRQRTPLERMSSRVRDWRLAGLAAAERRMRESPDRATKLNARQTMFGYAKAVVEDRKLFERVQADDATLAAWIRKVSVQSKARAAQATQDAADAAPALEAAAQTPPSAPEDPEPFGGPNASRFR